MLETKRIALAVRGELRDRKEPPKGEELLEGRVHGQQETPHHVHRSESHASVQLVHGPGDPSPRAGTHLPRRLAVRRPPRAAPEPGTFFAGRPADADRRHARARRRAPRLRNVCRHRGLPVAEGEGKRETLQCPYHAWTYGLDGSLRSAPRSDEEPGFPRDELGLVPSRLRHVGPVRVREPQARSRAARRRARLDAGADRGARTRRRRARFHTRWEAELEANWKVVCENFLECYHCQVAHPASPRLIDVVDGGLRALDATADSRASAAPARERHALRLEGELQRRSSTSSGRISA